MFDLIKAEFYRLIRKKSTYVYFPVMAVAYALVVFLRSGGFNEKSVANDAVSFFAFSPALVGGFLFTAVYTDDLNAKNLITLVGYGLGKAKIVLAKLLVATEYTVVVFALLPAWHFGLYALLGAPAGLGALEIVYATGLKYALLTLAYCAISSIVVYGIQRTTFAVVTYVLFAFYVVRTLLVAVANMFGWDASGYTISGLTDQIMYALLSGGWVVWPVAGVVAYLLVAVVASVLVFDRKEMEF